MRDGEIQPGATWTRRKRARAHTRARVGADLSVCFVVAVRRLSSLTTTTHPHPHPWLLDGRNNNTMLGQRRRPQPRARRRAGDHVALLDVLPEELLVHVARQLFRAPRGCWAAARLRQACKALKTVLQPIWEEMKRFRLERNLCVGVTIHRGEWRISNGGKANSWACFGVLPAAGRSCWSVRIDSTFKATGEFVVGVTDMTSRWAWGLFPNRGHIRRWHRDASFKVCGAPTKVGYPNAHLKHVLYTKEGEPFDLNLTATVGRTIRVAFDADLGVLFFGIDDEPLREAVRGFPRGEPMRPWLRTSQEDMLSVRPAIE